MTEASLPVAASAHVARDAFSAEGVPRALWWDAAAGQLALVDQTRLPGAHVVLRCASVEDVAEAIRRLSVRGAPAIGIAAAYALALDLRRAATSGAVGNGAQARARLAATAGSLRACRPTAVNLAWAVARVVAVAEGWSDAGAVAGGPGALAARLLAEAHAIAAEDAAACQVMGVLGAPLIAEGAGVLTHCNAGALATGGIGTALAPIYVAHAAGRRLHIYVDETRPVLQGARLTAWELARAGVPLTLIADDMAATFMARGAIQAVFVGADRIVANGDTANKIGTYGVAVLARAHGIPFYVVAPRSTVDLATADGRAIPIEERAAEEVTSVGGMAIAPAGVAVANPAFDVTPARYITAIVTERGIVRPPYGERLRAVCAPDAATMMPTPPDSAPLARAAQAAV